jgi:TolA-binding protein
LRLLSNIDTDAEQLHKVPLIHGQLRGATRVEERLTDGELYLRLGDYVRASVVLSDVVDNYPKHTAYPDALFLLGESLFKAGDYFGARTHYRMIIDRADEAAFRPFVQRALGRLIEIAIHIRDFEGVDAYFVRLSRLPPSDVEAATNYFRAKYLYSKAVGNAETTVGDVNLGQVIPEPLEQARVAFGSVGAGSPYYAQARYFIGVIDVLRGKLDGAVTAFEQARAAKVQDDDQRRVAELALIGIGRLNYEKDKPEAAIAAYQAIPRTSPLFGTALYEIAWVYIRIGDSTSAGRALEVLTVAVPDSKYIPDGKLLRGNLLLRDGRFDDATTAFGDVSTQFGAVRDELDRLLAQHEDPVAYFQQLVRDNISAFDVAAFLPEQASRWVTVEGDMQRGLGALADLNMSRQLVTETEGIAARLQGALSSPNPVNVFRDLRDRREGSTGLRNRLSQVRKALMEIDAKESRKYGSAELDQVRAQRREFERSIGGTPTGRKDIEQRKMLVLRQYSELAMTLSRLEVELLGMEARMTATKLYVGNTSSGRDASAIDAVRAELATQQAAAVDYRARIKQFELQVEAGRLQAGVGDQDFERDTALRKQHGELVQRERSVLKALGAHSDPQIESAFQRTSAIEGTLDLDDHEIDLIVAERVSHMRSVLNEETAKLVGYRTQLAQMEKDSEAVVGGIALENYRNVRKRFYDLVLRSDVGVIDVGWAVREEHRLRGETLSRQRSRDLKSLEDEFRDIMDQRESAP